MLARSLDQLFHRLHFTLEDHIGHERCIEHDLYGGATPLAINSRNETLGNNRLHIEREIHQQLMATLFREKVNDSIHRLVGIIGMQGSQTEVSGLGKGDSVLHRLRVTDLTYQDHIGCLTQRIDQSVLKGVGINAHLALSDNAPLVLVHKFNGILNGDDMPRGVRVTVVDHRRQRGRLAGTGATDKENNPPPGERKLLQNVGKIEIGKRGNVYLNLSQYRTNLIALLEDIDTKTTDLRTRNGKITFVGLFKLLALLGIHDAVDDLPCGVGREARL